MIYQDKKVDTGQYTYQSPDVILGMADTSLSSIPEFYQSSRQGLQLKNSVTIDLKP